jgi:hypothetical protein
MKIIARRYKHGTRWLDLSVYKSKTAVILSLKLWWVGVCLSWWRMNKKAR